MPPRLEELKAWYQIWRTSNKKGLRISPSQEEDKDEAREEEIRKQNREIAQEIVTFWKERDKGRLHIQRLNLQRERDEELTDSLLNMVEQVEVIPENTDQIKVLM